MKRHTIIDSPVGPLTVVADDGVLTGVYFHRHWTRPRREEFGSGADAGFDDIAVQLAEYFAGERRAFELRMRSDGDDFHRRVWDCIARIEYGRTTTYGEIAAELGDPSTARDVGAAVGRNPLSIVVPCHRVVGKDGALTGYAGGLERKRILLDLEQDQHARLF